MTVQSRTGSLSAWLGPERPVPVPSRTPARITSIRTKMALIILPLAEPDETLTGVPIDSRYFSASRIPPYRLRSLASSRCASLFHVAATQSVRFLDSTSVVRFNTPDSEPPL